jgi:hypothetical protein
MIILIISRRGRKFWTKSYKEEGDFFIFNSQTKAGVSREVRLHKDNVMELTTLEQDFPNEEEEKV